MQTKITTRNLTMLSIALAFYFIGTEISIPSINVPFRLFAIGVFLGIVTKPYNYLLYFFSLAMEIPDLYNTYIRMSFSVDGEINLMLVAMKNVVISSTTNTTVKNTSMLSAGVVVIISIALIGWLVYSAIISIMKNARLYFVIASYPLLFFGLFFVSAFVYVFYNGSSLATIGTNIYAITPFLRNLFISMIISMNVICMVFAPIYAYFVTRELKIYKRLGL